jgi:cell division protein FtsB
MEQKATERNKRASRTERAGQRASGIGVLKGLAAVLTILSLLLLYGIFLSPRGIQAYRQLQEQVNQLTANRNKLAQENQQLLRKIRAVRSNPDAQERLVKQELGWVREDEIIIEFAAPQK